MSANCTVNIGTPLGPGAYLVQLSGVLDELAELPRRLAPLSGIVVLDLDGVTRITSFGIRDWLRALKAMKVSYLAFTHCRPPMLRQFNMIKRFGGEGELISFHIPCLCTACDHYYELLIDLRDQNIGAPESLPIDPCPSCGGVGEFDESDDYLDYPGSCRRPSPPHRAQQLIDSDGKSPPSKLTLSKRLKGDVTYLNLHGALIETAKLRRWMDGLEGEVHIDMTGVRRASPGGIAQLGELLSGPRTRRSSLRAVRLDLCDRMAAVIDNASVEIGSVLAPARCRECGAHVEVEVAAGLALQTTSCHRCGASDSISLDSDVAQKAAASIDASEPPAARPATDPGGRRDTGFVASSPAFRRIIDVAAEVANADATVLIRGETGTGKELVARFIHSRSSRRDRPFIAVNCSAFPQGLIESELFGHESGAFTGASGRHIGRFERANTGTLFLDEVGDLPLEVQVKLLRTLQERYIERIGGQTPIPIDIRLIAATHRDLESMLASGEFREDLYYRLNVVPLAIPPLRERPEDILELAELYLARFQRRASKYGITLSKGTEAALQSYHWPGNVRELINLIERAVALTRSGSQVEMTDLGGPQASGSAATGSSTPMPRGDTELKEAVEHFEREMISRALEEAGGNRSEAARQLGVSRQALRHKMVKHGLT